MSADTQPVPIPLSRRWREFRIRFLPVVVFFIGIGCVALLWRSYVVPTRVTGMTVADEYVIRSARDGYVMQLEKNRFDEINEGELLFTMFPPDDDILRAQLGVLQAEIEAIRTGLEPAVGNQRNRLNYEEIRLDMLNARIQLSEDRLELTRLEREAARQKGLFEQDLISESEYDLVATARDQLTVRVLEQEQVLEELSERLDQIASLWDSDISLSQSVDGAIRVKEQELAVIEATREPMRVTSPGAGQLTERLVQNGEFVTAGEPVLTIKSRESNYVLAYLREPISVLPERGTPVTIHATGRNVLYEGLVHEIGPQLELIHEALMHPSMTIEYALPIRIEIEADAALLPGEKVDIRL